MGSFNHLVVFIITNIIFNKKEQNLTINYSLQNLSTMQYKSYGLPAQTINVNVLEFLTFL